MITATSASQSLQALVTQAAGGELDLGGFTFNVPSSVNINTGLTIQNGTINFTIPKDPFYGFLVGGNVKGLTFKNLTFTSNHGVLAFLWGGCSDFTMSECQVQGGGGVAPDGTLVFTLFASLGVDGVTLTYNNFHDDTSAAVGSFYGVSHYLCANNTFNKVKDGFQLPNAGDNITVDHNYVDGISRMFHEISMVNSKNVIVTDNVAINWIAPYFDSEFLSLVMTAGTPPPFVGGNYANTSPVGGVWGPKDPNVNRSGYGIEAGGDGATYSNNILISDTCAAFIGAMGKNILIPGNQFYGHALWGAVSPDPGPNGPGNATTPAPVVQPLSAAPPPPANTFAGPAFAPKPSAVQPPMAPVTLVEMIVTTVKVFSDGNRETSTVTTKP